LRDSGLELERLAVGSIVVDFRGSVLEEASDPFEHAGRVVKVVHLLEQVVAPDGVERLTEVDKDYERAFSSGFGIHTVSNFLLYTDNLVFCRARSAEAGLFIADELMFFVESLESGQDNAFHDLAKSTSETDGAIAFWAAFRFSLFEDRDDDRTSPLVRDASGCPALVEELEDGSFGIVGKVLQHVVSDPVGSR